MPKMCELCKQAPAVGYSQKYCANCLDSFRGAYECDLDAANEIICELKQENEELWNAIHLLIERFALELRNKELHFDHTNYDWREINDGYSEEHYYNLTDDEVNLLKGVIKVE